MTNAVEPMRVPYILLASLLLTLPFVATAHAEARTYDYVAFGASNPAVGPSGIILFPNSDDSPYTQAGVPSIGGVVVQGPFFEPFVLLAEDRVGDPPVHACFWVSDGPCKAAVEPSCANAVFLVPPIFAKSLSVFVPNVHATPDLDLCFGTTGTITVP